MTWCSVTAGENVPVCQGEPFPLGTSAPLALRPVCSVTGGGGSGQSPPSVQVGQPAQLLPRPLIPPTTEHGQEQSGADPKLGVLSYPCTLLSNFRHTPFLLPHSRSSVKWGWGGPWPQALYCITPPSASWSQTRLPPPCSLSRSPFSQAHPTQLHL